MPHPLHDTERRLFEHLVRLAPDEWGLVTGSPVGIGDTVFMLGLSQAFMDAHQPQRLALVVERRRADLARMFAPLAARIVEVDHVPAEALRGVS